MDRDRAARKKREKHFCPKFQGQMQFTVGNKHFFVIFSLAHKVPVFFLCNTSQVTISFSNCYGELKMWVEGDGKEEKKKFNQNKRRV